MAPVDGTGDDAIGLHAVLIPQWGASFVGEDHVRFRLWAPAQKAVRVRLAARVLAMTKSGEWFETTASGVAAGEPYEFLLDDGTTVPDPASRAQIGLADGPSMVVDPSAFAWSQSGWQGRPWPEVILYELHIGTFTPEGTFAAAIGKLDHIAALGITAIELMPVVHFGGQRGWGYDGVLHYAPHNAYGTPDDLRALVDAAHGLGLMVFLDVVYNHFGPEGNALGRYAPNFFHPEKHTPWGAAIAFDEAPVRDFFIDNAVYWLSEFRMDGLRFDAVDRIDEDGGNPHMTLDIAGAIRDRLKGRHIHLVTEDSRNLTHLRDVIDLGSEPVRLYDGDWNDDYHHAAHVLTTGEAKGYYRPFGRDPVGRLADALTKGYVFPGKPLGGGKPQPPSLSTLVAFLQNHDQIGNRAFGERLISLIARSRLRGMMAITILSPHIPMIFMGEEYGEDRPFFFFTDYKGALADAVRKGRRGEIGNFGGVPKGRSEADLADPNAPETLTRSQLDWTKPETDEGREWMRFVTTLFQLRQQFVVPLLGAAGYRTVSGRMALRDGGLIVIEWAFPGGRLSLCANVGEHSATAPSLSGYVFYAFADGDDGWKRLDGETMPPGAVVFALDQR